MTSVRASELETSGRRRRKCRRKATDSFSCTTSFTIADESRYRPEPRRAVEGLGQVLIRESPGGVVETAPADLVAAARQHLGQRAVGKRGPPDVG